MLLFVLLTLHLIILIPNKGSTLIQGFPPSSVTLFPQRKRNVFISDHVLNLPSHCERKEYKPIEKENWPKHGNIKYTKECHDKSNAEGFCYGVPKLELRKTANEWTKLIGTTRRESRSIREFLDLRVNLRREEGDKEVKDINAEGIRHDVESLDPADSNNIYQRDDSESDPATEDVWS